MDKNEKINPDKEVQNNIDDFIIDEGFTVAEEIKAEPSKNRKKTIKKTIKSIIWILFIFVFSIGLSALIMIGASDFLGIGPNRGNEYQIEIKQGSTTAEITEILYENGIVRNKLLFRIYSKLKGFESKYKYGVYVISDEEGYDGVAQKLINEGAKAETVTVMIPEMSTVDEIIELLVEAGVSTKSDLKNAIQEESYKYDFIEDIPYQSVYWRLEGYLFPETYNFFSFEDKKECARLAVDKMLQEMKKRFDGEMLAKADSMGYSMHEILSLASIIELEAGGASYEDKQKVAEIFYNRLNDWKDGAYLQSNPTRKYPYGSGKYDTYKTAGIPIGPLCSPSIDSIKAALNPSTSQSGYYYFITDKFMNFYYNKSYSAHINTQNRLISEGNYAG